MKGFFGILMLMGTAFAVTVGCIELVEAGGAWAFLGVVCTTCSVLMFIGLLGFVKAVRDGTWKP